LAPTRRPTRRSPSTASRRSRRSASSLRSTTGTNRRGLEKGPVAVYRPLLDKARRPDGDAEMAKKVARKGKKKLSKKYASFSGRMVMIGFGSIGQGVMPLIFRHIDIKPEQITVISAEDRGGLKELKKFGVTFIKKRITQENLRQTLDKRVGKGDFVVNLSVEVASTAQVEFCQEKGALY